MLNKKTPTPLKKKVTLPQFTIIDLIVATLNKNAALKGQVSVEVSDKKGQTLYVRHKRPTTPSFKIEKKPRYYNVYLLDDQDKIVATMLSLRVDADAFLFCKWYELTLELAAFRRS